MSNSTVSNDGTSSSGGSVGRAIYALPNTGDNMFSEESLFSTFTGLEITDLTQITELDDELHQAALAQPVRTPEPKREGPAGKQGETNAENDPDGAEEQDEATPGDQTDQPDAEQRTGEGEQEGQQVRVTDDAGEDQGEEARTCSFHSASIEKAYQSPFTKGFVRLADKRLNMGMCNTKPKPTATLSVRREVNPWASRNLWPQKYLQFKSRHLSLPQGFYLCQQIDVGGRRTAVNCNLDARWTFKQRPPEEVEAEFRAQIIADIMAAARAAAMPPKKKSKPAKCTDETVELQVVEDDRKDDHGQPLGQDEPILNLLEEITLGQLLSEDEDDLDDDDVDDDDDEEGGGKKGKDGGKKSDKKQAEASRKKSVVGKTLIPGKAPPPPPKGGKKGQESPGAKASPKKGGKS